MTMAIVSLLVQTYPMAVVCFVVLFVWIINCFIY